MGSTQTQADFHPQVPPIIIAMRNNPELLKKFDLSSVESLFTGAAPLGQETAEELQKQHSTWKIRQGYGEPFEFRKCAEQDS